MKKRGRNPPDWQVAGGSANDEPQLYGDRFARGDLGGGHSSLGVQAETGGDDAIQMAALFAQDRIGAVDVDALRQDGA